MKTLFLLLNILFGLWVIAFSNEHEHIGIEPISETNGVVLFALPGHKLPLTFLGSTVDHTDIEVVSLAPVTEPHAHIGVLVRADDTHFPINTPCDTRRNIGPVVCHDGDGLVLKMEHGAVLGEAEDRRPHQSRYKKQPLHAAKIAKN